MGRSKSQTEPSPADLARRERLVAAIREAERGNRGEVRVHIERRCPHADPLRRAAALFEALGMRQTAADTGVLLYVATDDRTAAVFAGAGIHGAARPGFWQHVIDELADDFRAGDALGGLTGALGHIGEILREHVPGEDTAGNELPDTVTTS